LWRHEEWESIFEAKNMKPYQITHILNNGKELSEAFFRIGLYSEVYAFIPFTISSGYNALFLVSTIRSMH